MSQSQKDDSQYTSKSVFRTTFDKIKSRLLEVTEELKMRRITDEENEVKVNKLITEKFEIKRSKEEKINELSKKIESLQQENQQLSKDFEEKMKMHEEDKATQNISINSSSKGITALKDEILALQLTKHGLEKKIKDQEHQLQMEVKNRVETLNKVSELQSIVQSLQEELQSVHNRLDYLTSLVIKTEQMHGKLTQINDHHKCIVNNYQEMLTSTKNELTLSKAEIVVLKQEKEELMMKFELNPTEVALGQDSNLSEMKLLCDQLETDLTSAREQKKFMMSSLAETNKMLSSLQLKYDEISQSNVSYKAELTTLRTENKSLSNMLEQKENFVSELHNKLKELDKVHAVMASINRNSRRNNGRLSPWKRDISERHSKRQKFDEKFTSFESKICALEITMKSCERERDTTHRENSRLTTEVYQLENQVKNYEKQLETSKIELLAFTGKSFSNKESQTVTVHERKNSSIIETDNTPSHACNEEERKGPCEENKHSEGETERQENTEMVPVKKNSIVIETDNSQSHALNEEERKRPYEENKDSRVEEEREKIKKVLYDENQLSANACEEMMLQNSIPREEKPESTVEMQNEMKVLK